MTEDRDAEVCQFPRPEDIPLDLLKKIDRDQLPRRWRALRLDRERPDDGASRFANYI